MKRFLILLLALAVLACGLAASAEGVLTVTQQNFHVVTSGSSITGYLYAKLENTGDAPLKIDTASLEIYDADGNVLASSTTLWRFAEYLQPGEYTYGYMNPSIKDIESADVVADYAVEITGRDLTNRYTFRLPVETVFEPGVEGDPFNSDTITTTLTNDADQTVFDIAVMRVLLDDAGNILYLDSDNMYSYKGLTPGSSIVVRRQVPNSFRDYFTEKGYKPAAVDSIGYAYGENETTYTRGGAPQAEAEPGAEPEAQAEPEATYETLQKGSKGDAVRTLQKRLKELGFLSGSADGDFGKGTAGAVSAFQKKAGLPENGVADDATQKALFADDAPHA